MATNRRKATRTLLWPALLLFLAALFGDQLFRQVPEFDELDSVTAAVTAHDVHDAKLHFQLDGVDQLFEVPAKGTEQWYAITAAAETKSTLTVWTWPAVLDGRGWPFVPFFHGQPWQIECEGETLLSYQERTADGGFVKLVSGIAFLLSAAALGRWFVRARRPDVEPRPVRRRKRTGAVRKKESESTSSAMPTSARWFWDIFGALIFAVVVGLGVKSTFDRATPIPVASELVELSGVVADVQVEKRRVHYDSNTYEIAGFSFELEGREGRWEIPERHRYYELLARGLVPGVEARLLVANADWVAEHGEPLAVEQLWGAEVDGEPVVSLAQMTAAARRSREKSEPWWPFVIVALASLACFAHGRLWGRGSRA